MNAATTMLPTTPSVSSPIVAAKSTTGNAPATMPTTPLKEKNDAEYEITSPGANAIQNTDTTADATPAEDTSILQLLQIAQESGFTPVAIPGNLLADLLTSMSNLQTRVTSLQADVLELDTRSTAIETALAHTKLELEAIKEKFGVTIVLTFPEFPKLPAELRAMIVSAHVSLSYSSQGIFIANDSMTQWHLALFQPQIIEVTYEWKKGHITSGDNVGTRYNRIREVCREARDEAKKHQGELRTYNPNNYDCCGDFGRPSVFSNREVDILWYHGDRENVLMDLFCSFWGYTYSAGQGPHQVVPLIAMTLADWMESICRDWDETYIFYLGAKFEAMRVEHISIVVGDIEALGTKGGRLIKPRKVPSALLPVNYQAQFTDKVLSKREEKVLTWESLESWHMESLAEFQEERARQREEWLADGGKILLVTKEDIDTNMYWQSMATLMTMIVVGHLMCMVIAQTGRSSQFASSRRLPAPRIEMQKRMTMMLMNRALTPTVKTKQIPMRNKCVQCSGSEFVPLACSIFRSRNQNIGVGHRMGWWTCFDLYVIELQRSTRRVHKNVTKWHHNIENK